MSIRSEIQFLKSICDLVLSEDLFGADAKHHPVIDYKSPHELKQLIEFDIDKPVDNHELVRLCKTVVTYSVKTSHPYFFNQLYGGVDLYGLAGTWISEALNTNQHTYEIAPAFTLAENAVLQHVRRVFGYEEQGDGIFVPGGSLSNMYGLVLARYMRFPDIKTKGMHSSPRLACFTSEDSHYSIKKGCNWLGIGTDNIYFVKTDEFGRMKVDDLESCIVKARNDGKVPLFVNATAGTTVLGAIDPIDEISSICQQYNLWLHVDACFAGTLMLSHNHRMKLKGIERSDSFAWNPHKMLGAPLQCSVFITKHPSLLHCCNSEKATYLFQPDKHYDVDYDTGDKSLQCGRKVDAFKLWVMWKARGDDGFNNLIENSVNCANYFKELIRNRDGFRLVIDSNDSTCVCFWYIPLRLRNKEENNEWWQQLYQIAPQIKSKMVHSGKMMMNYMPLPHKNIGNFLRFVVCCQPEMTREDINYCVELIDNFGATL